MLIVVCFFLIGRLIVGPVTHWMTNRSVESTVYDILVMSHHCVGLTLCVGVFFVVFFFK